MTREIDLDRLVRFYETLERGTLHAGLAGVYAPDAFFKDPFNEVRGLDAIETIFMHMYERVEQPRFVITHRALNGPDAFLVWDFIFKMPRISDAPQCVRGATHLRFNAAGKVEMHRDFWDAAEELYEKLPVLGAFMRWIKRRTNS
jgi:steroid delta-isomerase